jgi:hypothetical protein
MGFVVDKMALGQVSPANSHCTDCSTFIIIIIIIIIIYPGLVQ